VSAGDLRDLNLHLRVALTAPTNTDASWWTGPGWYVRIAASEGYESLLPRAAGMGTSVAYACLDPEQARAALEAVGAGAIYASAQGQIESHRAQRIAPIEQTQTRLADELAILKAQED
jgi:hypothetical protein